MPRDARVPNLIPSAAIARALIVALPLLLWCCGSEPHKDRSAGGSSVGPGSGRPALPDPVQLEPPGTLERLTRRSVDRVVSAALADPTVARALAHGEVGRVIVRSAATGMPGGDPAGTVAFLFDAPVTPASSPFEVLCDIAGQTPQWRGVAARVVLDGEQVESSPVWLTGANCVGMIVPKDD